MTFFEAVFLGIVQGLTEFLPVSSSGHLVLVQNLFGLREPMLAFDVVVHLGTLTAVFFYYARDLFLMIVQTAAFIFSWPRKRESAALIEKYPYARLSFMVILATLPTVVIGLLFKDKFEAMFGNVTGVAVSWTVLGVFLILSRWLRQGNRELGSMRLVDALAVGCVQGIAIMPGISRSGSTILAGMALGLEKKECARFSFLLAVPAILGAGVLELRHRPVIDRGETALFAAGFLVSAVVGYLAIALLVRMIRGGRFHYFGYYCLALGLAVLGASAAGLIH